MEINLNRDTHGNSKMKLNEIFNKKFLEENMMGPCSPVILEELLEQVEMRPGMRVLDLGCGRGLTSVYLAKKYSAQVFAVDLWISASDNYERFEQMGVADMVIPIHADAHDMPFADGYFDAVVSVDSYHYFGNNDTFFLEKICPLLKPGGIFAAAFPGMKNEISREAPEEMRQYWDDEALTMWHSADWWKPKFENKLQNFRIWELSCFDRAWQDWLGTENPYAVQDRDMISTDNGRFMNLIGITGKLKQ